MLSGLENNTNASRSFPADWLPEHSDLKPLQSTCPRWQSSDDLSSCLDEPGPEVPARDVLGTSVCRKLYVCFFFMDRLSIARDPKIVSILNASGMYNVCTTASLYPERTSRSLSLPM
jgi:hypothetical protein